MAGGRDPVGLGEKDIVWDETSISSLIIQVCRSGHYWKTWDYWQQNMGQLV